MSKPHKLKEGIISMRDTADQQKGLRELISYVNAITLTRSLTMYEIGSYAGESAEIFAENFKKIYCVDPWEHGYDDERDWASHNNGEIVENAFDARVRKYDNVVKRKIGSIDCSKDVEDNSIDLVYIDGNHKYEAILEDIKAWFPKIKTGGFLSGHDYWSERTKKAIRDNGFYKIDQSFSDHSWVIRKGLQTK